MSHRAIRKRLLVGLIVLCGVSVGPLTDELLAIDTPKQTPPNVVLILTDDQRWDSLWAMPTVQRDLAFPGITFANAYVVNPSCCPSRASLLTGQYAHTTGVWRNHGTYGGFDAFDDSSTLATLLDGVGYETALLGKYLNGYRNNTYVPPGWDHWVAFTGQRNSRTGNYYNYDLNVNGTIVQIGDRPRDYATDFLAREAARFLLSAPEPFFLVFTPPAPHAPALPPRRHADAFDDLAPSRPINFNEQDISDKPRWVRQHDELDERDVRRLDELRRRQYQTLLAVDDAVGRIMMTLTDTGRLADTALFFTSDNGFLLGEHRLAKKAAAYEETIRVPLLFRYDPLGRAGMVITMPVLNIDLSPTIAELASATLSDADGESLLPLIQGSGEWSREEFLIEHLGRLAPGRIGRGVPTYCAVHTSRHVFVVYAEGANELYDLRRDPFELRNRLGHAPRRLVRHLRSVLTSLCVPPPPGFDRLG